MPSLDFLPDTVRLCFKPVMGLKGIIDHKMNSVLKVQHTGTFLISLPNAFQLNF